MVGSNTDTGAKLAERRVAPGRWARPACTEFSRRRRFGFLGVALPLASEGVAGVFAVGGRFADSDGDGEEPTCPRPLV